MEDNNFNKTELFENCYCQKVLPLAYDNSLSYYEVLCKLTGKINELIDIINETGNTISEETEQRSEADTQLQNNINTEKTARENADAQLQTNIDTLSNDTFHKNQVVPIANGGTNASSPYEALKNLNTTYTVQSSTIPTEGVSGNLYISANNILCTIYNKNGNIKATIPASTDDYFIFSTYDIGDASINFSRRDIGLDKYSNFIGVECRNGVLKFTIYKGKTTNEITKNIYINNMNFTLIK